MGRFIQIIMIFLLLMGCSYSFQTASQRFPEKNANLYEFACWYYDPVTLWFYDDVIDCKNRRNKND